MRTRLWYEMAQAKMNEQYLTLLIGHQRRVMNNFNLVVTLFSTAGIMGWKVWDKLPLVACFVIAAISLVKLVQQNIIPTDKQIERLEKASDFYFDFYLGLERIWFDFEKDRIDELEMQNRLHSLKQTERQTNQIINEAHKRINKKISQKAEIESQQFFSKAFNNQS